MPMSKSDNKVLEVTRDTYFEDIEWECCIFGAVQMGERERGKNFFKGLDMGANTSFEVSNMGARTFLTLKKWGQELF